LNCFPLSLSCSIIEKFFSLLLQKTKPWIPKSKALTFELVYRSNRDLKANEKDASPLVLVPKIADKHNRERDNVRLFEALNFTSFRITPLICVGLFEFIHYFFLIRVIQR
jgi:hypothetical protein